MSEEHKRKLKEGRERAKANKCATINDNHSDDKVIQPEIIVDSRASKLREIGLSENCIEILLGYM